MSLNSSFIKDITNFRQQLHSFPELSGKEQNTAKAVVHFLSKTNPSEVITNIGGHGLAVIYDSGNAGTSVLIRADLDALPIQEANTLDYKSITDGVAHLCGHDGHMAIVAGLGILLFESSPKKGRVILLFQPAEETGQGAELVLKDKKFQQIKPDYAFALHNLSGYEKGYVCIKNGGFASASTGIIIKLKGLSSHAAHPEDGNNPDKTLANLILRLNEINSKSDLFNDFALLTVIHARLGEKAFGTTPGKAVLMATLRTYRNDDMQKMKELTEKTVFESCSEFDIKYDISYTEEFPATFNDDECVELIKKSAIANNVPVITLESPFRWSEDFGHFTQSGKAALFGIGAGKENPQLHNEDYDFPDEIIEPAIITLKGILDELKII